MCKGTVNWEDVYIIKKEIIPKETLNRLNESWIDHHGGIPVDKCIGKEIEQLIIRGVVTVGSCCGHGKEHSHALAHKRESNKIESLGYITEPYQFDLIKFNLKTGG